MEQQNTTTTSQVKNSSVWTKISQALAVGACGGFLFFNPAFAHDTLGFSAARPLTQSLCVTHTTAWSEILPSPFVPPVQGSFPPSQSSPETVQTGVASWYGPRFHGKRTANGETYNQYALTAAHRTFPLGSQVFVTNLRTKQSVVVRINDRGPYIEDRIIDLSYAAAQSIRADKSGITPVRLEVLIGPDNQQRN